MMPWCKFYGFYVYSFGSVQHTYISGIIGVRMTNNYCQFEYSLSINQHFKAHFNVKDGEIMIGIWSILQDYL